MSWVFYKSIYGLIYSSSEVLVKKKKQTKIHK